jgi:predicted DNA-binding transcriptional regulator YafY
VIGWCHERKALRTFLLDRVGAVVATVEWFERNRHFKPEELIQDAFGPWSGAPERIRLRFAASTAPFAAERKVHRSQVSQWRSDGTLGVTLRMPPAPALVGWILSYGSKVRVITPKKLAQAIRAEHLRAAKSAPL